MRSMEPYFSFQPWRRCEWKGHRTKANVRNVISTARRSGRPLRVFATGVADGWVTYTEIQPADWDVYFAEGEV